MEEPQFGEIYPHFKRLYLYFKGFMEEPKPRETYLHFKGLDYEIIAVAQDSDNPEKKSVVYKSLYGGERFPIGTVWSRSLENFLETVDFRGEKIRRFTKIN